MQSNLTKLRPELLSSRNHLFRTIARQLFLADFHSEKALVLVFIERQKESKTCPCGGKTEVQLNITAGASFIRLDM